MKLSLRVKNLKPSPTLALAAKAKEMKAKGHNVISLTVGEPDWDTFEKVKQVAIKGILEGDTKYTPSNGILELREVIARQINTDFSMDYNPSQVTVSTGGKFVIFSALQALLDPGDEVIIPAPYWVSYPTQVELAGGKPIFIQTQSRNRFVVTAEELEKSISSKTKLLILNSPSNPTGNMYTREALKELSEVLLKYPNVNILSDDIYNRLVFNGKKVAPHILEVCPQIKDRVIIINGVAKSYSMTGWRLGWAVGNKELIDAMTNYQSQSVSCVPGFIQRAALYAIENSENDIRQSVKMLIERKNLTVSHLRQLPNVQVEDPDGAFYVWPDIRYYIGKKWKGKTISSSSEFASLLLENKMVAVVPGIEFGIEGFLRMSYTLGNDKMLEAISRIREFISEIVD